MYHFTGEWYGHWMGAHEMKVRFASCVGLAALTLAAGVGCGSSDSSNGFNGDDGGTPSIPDSATHKGDATTPGQDSAASGEDSSTAPDTTTGDDTGTGGGDSPSGDSTVGDGTTGESSTEGGSGDAGPSEGGPDATVAEGGTGDGGAEAQADAAAEGATDAAADAVAEGAAGDAGEDGPVSDAASEAAAEAGNEGGSEAGGEGGTEGGTDGSAEGGDAGVGPMCQTDAGVTLCAAGQHCCVNASTQAASCSAICPSGTSSLDCIGATDNDAAVNQCGTQNCCGTLTLTGGGFSGACTATALSSACQDTCNDTAPATCTAGTYTVQLCTSAADCAGNQRNQTQCCQFGVSPLYWCATGLEAIAANNCL